MGKQSVQRKHQDLRKGGIGIYSYDQIKNTRPIGRIGAMLIGAAWILAGVANIYKLELERTFERRAFGSATLHLMGFVLSVSLIAGGIFCAHVGVIYYWRKLRWWCERNSNKVL